MVALVMSGGGPLAVAWEAGLLAGLEHEGVGFPDAELVLGTSAGAIVGAQMCCGRPPSVIAAEIVDEGRGGPPRGGVMRASPDALARLPSLLMKAQSPSPDAAAVRAEIGAYATSVPTPGEEAAVRPFAAMVGEDWPDRPFGCVAVDAASGEVKILTRDCGASLASAVAASCSLPGISPPITIGSRRYIDGGFASIANADLARGFGKVVVVAFHRAGPSAQRVAETVQRQAAALRGVGAEVLVVHPDVASLSLIGDDGMNFKARPSLAEAGISQGAALAGKIAKL